MRPNPFLDAVREGGVALGGWLSNPSTLNAEIMSTVGFDYITVDCQHGLIDYTTMLPMLQVLGLGSATPMVRVPELDAGDIGKALDAGARAVIVPMVNDGVMCEQAMRATAYAPRGDRSYGPNRAILIEGDDYFEHAAEQVSMIPMIETAEAISHLDAIMSVDGVEAIYVGPSDLAISLGLAPGTTDPRLDEAFDAIVAGCRKHGVAPGIHASAALCERRLEQGFRMITVSADLVALRRAVADDYAKATATVPTDVTSLY